MAASDRAEPLANPARAQGGDVMRSLRPSLAGLLTLVLLAATGGVASADELLSEEEHRFYLSGSGNRVRFELRAPGPTANVYDLLIITEKDAEPADPKDRFGIALRMPGSLQLTIPDDAAYFVGSPEIHYSVSTGTERYFEPTTEELAAERHWRNVVDTSFDALIGLVPIAGDVFTIYELMMLADLPKSPEYLMTTDLVGTSSTYYGDGQFEQDDVLTHSGAEGLYFNEDRLYDVATASWHQFASRGLTDLIWARFEVDREPGHTEALPVGIRAVVPLEHVNVVENINEYGVEYEDEFVRHYFVELETAAQLPAIAPVATPTATSTPAPGESYVTADGVTLLVGERYSGNLGNSGDYFESYGAKQGAYHSIDVDANITDYAQVVAKDTISGYPTIHATEFLTDGRYGNGSSWVAASSDSWIKIRWISPTPWSLIRFGRDRLEGGYNDRDPGHFTIEVAGSDPAWADGNDDNDAAEYTEIFDSADTDFDGDLSAKESIVVSFPSAVQVQYVKLNLTKSGAAIDEFEVLTYPDYPE